MGSWVLQEIQTPEPGEVCGLRWLILQQRLEKSPKGGGWGQMWNLTHNKGRLDLDFKEYENLSDSQRTKDKRLEQTERIKPENACNVQATPR